MTIVPVPGLEHRIGLLPAADGAVQGKLVRLARTPNDTHDGATDLGSGLGVHSTADLLGAGLDEDEALVAGEAEVIDGGTFHRATVWWTWTAPRDATFAVSTQVHAPPDCGVNVTAETIEIMSTSGQASGGAEMVASGADRVEFGATGGEAYAIRVWCRLGSRAREQLHELVAPGSLLVEVQVDGPRTPGWEGVGNDDFANPIELGRCLEADSAAGPMVWMAEAGEPDHGGRAAAGSAWWKWTAPEPGQYIVAPGAPNVATAVYVGDSLERLSTVVSGTGAQSFDAEADRTYRIAVDGGPSHWGFPHRLRLAKVQNPGNDPEARTPYLGAGSTGGWSEWFRLPANGESPGTARFHWGSTSGGAAVVRAQVLGGNGTAGLRVLEFRLGAGWSEVSSGTGATGFEARPGSRYAVDVNVAATSAVALEIAEAATRIRNDRFSDATKLPVHPDGRTVERDDPLFGASLEPGEPTPTGAAGSVWYRFSLPRASLVTLESELPCSLYDGSSLEALQALRHSYGSSPVRIALKQGGTYCLQVRARDSDELWIGRARFSIRAAAVTPNTDHTNAAPLVPAPDGSWRGQGVGLDCGELWWTWTAGASGLVEILDPHAPETTVRVRAEDGISLLGILQPLWKTEDGRHLFEAVAGQNYLVSVHRNGAGEREIALRMSRTVAPPSNDDFARPVDLGDVTSFTVATGLPASTTQYGELDHAGRPAQHSQWWSWDAPAPGPGTVEIQGGAARVVFYRGSNFRTLEPVSAFDAPAGLYPFNLPEAGALTVCVDPGGESQSTISVRLAAGGLGNGEPDGAIALEGERWDWEQDAWGVRELWFRWEAPRSGRTRIAMSRDGAELEVANAAGDKLPLHPTGVGSRQFEFEATAGELHQIRLEPRSEMTAAPIALTLAMVPSNNRFADRTDLGDEDHFALYIDDRVPGFDREPGEPLHQGSARPDSRLGDSSWWSWEPPTDGWLVIEPNRDWLSLTAYHGEDVRSLEEVFSVRGPDPTAVRVEGGKTYALALVPLEEPEPGQTGARALGWFYAGRAPGNDAWEDAEPVYVGRFRLRTVGATIQPGEPDHGVAGGSVWWRWDPNAWGTSAGKTELMSFELRSSLAVDPTFSVYTGGSIESLELVARGQRKVTWAASGDDPRPYWIAWVMPDSPTPGMAFIQRTELEGQPFGPYAEWADATMGPGSAPHAWAQPGSDPDGDGRSNIEEFGTGTDPLVAEPSAPYQIRLSWVPGFGGPEAAVPGSVAGLGLRRHYEVSHDLRTWRRLDDDPGFFDLVEPDPGRAGAVAHRVQLWRWLPGISPSTPLYFRVAFERD